MGKNSLEKYCEKLRNPHKEKTVSNKKIYVESLVPWKSSFLTKADKNISRLKTRTKHFKPNFILKQTNVTNYLEKLKKNLF